MHTELGRSQVEVQRCTLSWEVSEELGRVGKAEVEVEIDVDMVEEKLEEEEEEEEEAGRALIKSHNPHLAGGEKTLKENT